MSRVRYLVAVLLTLSLVPFGSATEPEDSDTGVTAIFVHYYTAVSEERWSDAFQFLHDRLKSATEVHSPEDLAQRHSRDQYHLIHAFETFDRIEVVKTEMDLSSIKGYVKSSGAKNVAGMVSYDLRVFLKGPRHPRMYRVVTDVGLDDGRIIRITQHSMVRIDADGLGDAV